MGATSGIGSGAAGPWYRVQAILADGRQGASAERDYASVLPAVLNAAMHRRPFIAGWLSRGGGAPLELITNAGPLPEPGAPDRQAQAARLQGRTQGRREFGEPSRAIDHDALGARGGLFDERDDLDSSVVIESSRIIGPGGVIEPSRVINPGRPLCSGPAGGTSVIVEPSRSGGGALDTVDAIEPSSLFEPKELLFPWGARGVPMPGSLLTDLDRLLWAPCPGRQAPPLGWDTPQLTVEAAVGYLGARDGRRGGNDAAGRRQTLFESALVTLMARPFGRLVVAEPSELIDTEIAELRTQLNVLRRYDEEHSRFDASRAERRLAELDAFREAGLWNVRVLAGAATEQELRLIAPVLVGSVDLAAHPYRLRSPEEPRDLADALASKLADPVDGAQVPFAATAGALAALTGLPRGEVPGVRVLDPTSFDVTSETMSEAVSALSAEMSADGDPRGEAAIDLGAILDGQDRRVGTFRVPFGTLNRHAFITGATGSGKSQTVRHMLEQLTGAGIPWLGRAGQVRVRGHGRPDRRKRPHHGHQPVRPGRGAIVGEPAGTGAGLPGAGAHRHGAGAVPGRVRREGAVPADHLAGAAAGLRGLRLVPGDRGRAAGSAGRTRRPDPRPAAARGARRHRRRRLRPGTAGRRPGLCRRAAALAADRLRGPVLRRRAPGRHRRAAAAQRGAGDRGRRQRRGQGVPDRHADHPAGRAPADARPHRPSRRPCARDRHRGGAPAAARQQGGCARACRRAVREPARGDPRLRRGDHGRGADPGQAPP